MNEYDNICFNQDGERVSLPKIGAVEFEIYQTFIRVYEHGDFIFSITEGKVFYKKIKIHLIKSDTNLLFYDIRYIDGDDTLVGCAYSKYDDNDRYIAPEQQADFIKLVENNILPMESVVKIKKILLGY